MSKALIVTVGTSSETGKDIIDTLTEYIQEIRPSFISFVVTNLTKRNAQRIIHNLNLNEDTYEIVELESSHNIEETFQKANSIIRRLSEKGIAPNDISVNFTSGTKVMSAGTVLAAIFNSCNHLCYISGIHNQEGSNCVIVTSARGIFAYRELQFALSIAKEMRFISAKDVLSNIDVSLLSSYESSMVAELLKIVTAYSYWDNFRYSDFLEMYKTIDFDDYKELMDFKLDNQYIDIIRQIKESVEKQDYNRYLLIDIYNNAVRRKIEGKYDDSVARFYRVTEMLAQWVLINEYAINTDDLDTRKVPPKYRSKFEILRDMEDGKVKIGLRRSYELLDLLDNKIGIYFTNDEEMKRIFLEQHRTLLAHGITPTTEETCRRFMLSVEEIMKVQIPDFGEKCFLLQFPWIRHQK